MAGGAAGSAARRTAAASHLAPPGLAELGTAAESGPGAPAPGAEFLAPVCPAGSGVGRSGGRHSPAAAGRRRPDHGSPAGGLGVRRDYGASGAVGDGLPRGSAGGKSGGVVAWGAWGVESALKASREAGPGARSSAPFVSPPELGFGGITLAVGCC